MNCRDARFTLPIISRNPGKFLRLEAKMRNKKHNVNEAFTASIVRRQITLHACNDLLACSHTEMTFTLESWPSSGGGIDEHDSSGRHASSLRSLPPRNACWESRMMTHRFFFSRSKGPPMRDGRFPSYQPIVQFSKVFRLRISKNAKKRLQYPLK